MPVDFEVYSIGMCCASVCTTLSDEAATLRLNLEEPATPAVWAISADKTFHSGQPNPNPCENSPDTHRHILFNC